MITTEMLKIALREERDSDRCPWVDVTGFGEDEALLDGLFDLREIAATLNRLQEKQDV